MTHRHPSRAGLILLGAILAALAAGGGPFASSAPPDQIRDPAVAGQFYPADRAKLTAALEGFFADAVPDRGEHPPVLIVPHAGYIYSGQIAADAFAQVAKMTIDTVVILGANHTTAGFDRVSVYDGAAYRTPLGQVEVDRDLAAVLARDGEVAVLDHRLHEREHSVEVQVPFVQHVFPRARIVPLVVATASPGVCARFGRALAEAVHGRNVLIVASSDLSHYPAADAAARVDAVTLEQVASMDAGALVQGERDAGGSSTPNLVTRACGLGPVLVAIEAARRLGARRGVVLSYANSASVAVGSRERAVGYGAVAFAGGDGRPDLGVLRETRPDRASRLEPAEKRRLLRLARDTVTRYLASETLPLPRGGSPALLREAGVFVTLRKGRDLRGCVGRLVPEGPLLRLVSAMALESALEDPRFSPVRPGELKGLDFEVSVLSPLTRIPGPEFIVPGRDGVVLELGGRSAVFLPQVAAEEGWGRDELLDNLALKAGLGREAWRSAGVRLLTFQADVFRESQFK
ncbi:MAG: AmmeMemoRadiSam system protein B [Acidobacteriota bacterium]